MPHDIKTIERFMELRAKGESFSRIAKKLKVGKQTLIKWDKEYREEIANRKAAELEALQEKYYLTVERSIKFYGEKIGVLETELAKRDLADLGTKEIYELLLEYRAELKELGVSPVFLSEDEIHERQGERQLLETITEPLQDHFKGKGTKRYGT
ncbi:hypothetical protein [Priestia endophytica]|uniref:hypothetical protein n=1 Tax=Priestia endophytica TaxID=135735 RepID=UPI00124F37C2|nr:hypothetical protein [Priestia endophytica]KAB2494242.1 hypothetical protein F8155_11535 [Priestia endophytica]